MPVATETRGKALQQRIDAPVAVDRPELPPELRPDFRPELRPQLDAATGIAVGLIFGIAAWCLFALAIVGLVY
ncbi:MAG TPA: hypothetical protein VGH36_14755 [Acetobacteraceae bacterium]|jgi:hypothetical protein